MIECYDKNVWYVKKRRKKSVKFFVFFFTVIFIVCLFVSYRYLVTDNVIGICSDYVYRYSTESVNKAVMQSLNDNVKYSNLVTVEKNSSGDIVLMTTDSLKVNSINREIALSTHEILLDKLKDGVEIPLMAFFGVEFLSGYGTPIKLKTTSVSDVVCEFVSKFESVGINQTLHSIYIDVVSTVNIEIPLNKRVEKCKTSVLVCESVLVGKVPEVYLKGNLFS